MLDNSILDQLKSVFGKLEKNVELVYKASDHADQKSLVEMLEQVASTSENITFNNYIKNLTINNKN